MAAYFGELSEHQLRDILAASAEQVGVGPDCGAILEGSLAEGFGNENSDIDLVFVNDGREHLTMPSILFVDGRRVEVRRRSAQQVRRQAAEVLRLARVGPSGLRRISRDLLDRVQRFSGSLTLRDSAQLAELKTVVGPDELAEVVSSWYALSARDSAKAAVLFESIRADSAAISNARTAVVHATKSWLGRRGETYLEPKWIYEQLARTPGGPEIGARLAAAEPTRSAKGTTSERVRRAIEYLSEVGLPPVKTDPGLVTLQPVRGVTTWAVGGRVHVLKGKQEVYVLGDVAGAAWRALPFEQPLPEVIREVRASGVESPYFLAELQRLGLITFRWKGEGHLEASAIGGGAPLATMPLVTLKGGRVPDGGEDRIHMLPLPARRFVKAGMALMWSNVIVENALEDARGAVKENQWGVFSVVLRRCVRYICIAVISAFGVAPWPPAEEALSVLSRLRLVSKELAEQAGFLESAPVVGSSGEALALLSSVEHLVGALRQFTDTELFPASFEGGVGWRDTLALGNDWLRLSAYLGVTPPKEEAQDMVGGDLGKGWRAGPGGW